MLMSDFEQIYEWLKTCPNLYNLWVVSSLLEDRRTILQPNSAAPMYKAEYAAYVDNGKKYTFTPTEPYYFDMDIICYREVYADENAENICTQKDIQAVCDWLIEQQNTGNAPQLDKYPCYQVECLTPIPFIRNEWQSENNPGAVLVDYAVTVRFYTVNPAKKIIKVM